MNGPGTADGAPDVAGGPAGNPSGNPSGEANRPGSVLRAEREALGVSVREVAETLNLSIGCVEALEADDFARLPGTVFARGYLRAYARLLELDPEPLLAQYPEAPEAFGVGDVPPQPAIWEWVRRRPLVVLGSAAVAVLVLFILVIAALWPDSEPEPAAGAANGAAVAEPFADGAGDGADTSAPAAAGVTAADGAAAPGGEITATDDAQAGAAAPPRATLPARAQRTDEAVPAVAVEPVAEGGPPARRITDVGDDRLSFTFSDDCWVEVRSSSGATLYSDLNRADSMLDLIGSGPFRILLGYAPGARLTFNGEPVPLGPYTRNNVANLVLGQ